MRGLKLMFLEPACGVTGRLLVLPFVIFGGFVK
jgi:hypothetical protein